MDLSAGLGIAVTEFPMVDHTNLGRKAFDEFADFVPPDDPRKFPELCTVHRLDTNSVNPAAKVAITTIQRLYSMLKGEPEYDADDEEGSAFDTAPVRGAAIRPRWRTTPRFLRGSSTSLSPASAIAPCCLNARLSPLRTEGADVGTGIKDSVGLRVGRAVEVAGQEVVALCADLIAAVLEGD